MTSIRSFMNLVENAGRESVTTLTEIRTLPDPRSNPNFVRWFGNSVMADRSGKPLVLYHGTRKDFSAFQPGHDYHGGGIFFSVTPGGAAGYGSDINGGRIIPAYLRIEKPFEPRGANWPESKEARAILDAIHRGQIKPGSESLDDLDWEGQNAGEVFLSALAGGDYGSMENLTFQAWLRANGYDGFFTDDGEVNYVVFDPRQIKSVYNKGTFDPNDPDIMA